MAVYPLSGKLYTSPRSAHGPSGTLVPGVVDNIQDSFSVQFSAPIEYARTGLGANGGIESRGGHEGPLLLLVPLKDNGAASLTILLSHLTTAGANFVPTGTGATKAHGQPPSFAMVVRPISATELHLYAPAWRVAENADLKAIYGQDSSLAMFSQNILPLIANRAPGQTTRAWMLGTAAAIDTEYSLSENPA